MLNENFFFKKKDWMNNDERLLSFLPNALFLPGKFSLFVIVMKTSSLAGCTIPTILVA